MLVRMGLGGGGLRGGLGFGSSVEGVAEDWNWKMGV
jgi:hypothetical protein